MLYTIRAIWTLKEGECLSLQWTSDWWEFLQHPLKSLAFGSFVLLLFNCCLCDSIYHLEPLLCVMNFLNLKCENLLLNTGLLRGRCHGGRSHRTQQGEGGGETWHALPASLPPLPPPQCFLLPLLPHFISFPSLSMSRAQWHPVCRQDLQGAQVDFHTRRTKRYVYHQLEQSGLQLRCGKINNIISLLPWSVSLLCSNIINNQQEKHICRGNFQAWLILFVSSAGQSIAVWRGLSEHNPSGEAEGAVNKLRKFNDIWISEWLLKWCSG